MNARPSISWTLLCIGMSQPAAAQSILELIPFGGSYIPFTVFATTETIAEAPQGGPIRTSEFREAIGVLTGARLRLSLNDNVKLQGSGAYVWSGWRERQQTRIEGAQAVGFSLQGNVIQATGQILYQPSRTNAYGSLGLTYMVRGGDAWDEDKWVSGTEYNKINIGAVVGFGVNAAASGSLNFDISVESHVYQVDKVEAGFVLPGNKPFESKGFQADLVVTVGIPISLIAR